MTPVLLPSIALLLLGSAQDVQERVQLPAQEEITQRTPIPPTPGPATLVVYDVADLVRFAQYPVDEPADGEAEDSKARDEKLQAETEALAEFLSDHVQPPLAVNGEAQETVRASHKGVVVALARPEQHAWIDRTLTLHRSGQRLIHIRVKYVQGPRGCFDEYGKDGTVSFLEDEQELETFLRFAEGAGMEVIQSPELVAFNRQRCTVSVMNQVAYVKEYRLIVVEPGEQEIADPIVDTVSEGYAFNVRAALLEADVYALDLELTRAQIQRPIPTRKMRLSPAIQNEVEISTPVCTSSTIESKLVVAEGAAVLFLSPSNEDGRDLACVVTVDTIPAQPLDGFAPPADEHGERR